MANKEKNYIEIGSLEAQAEKILSSNPEVTSDEYLELHKIRFEISKRRNRIARATLLEKYKNGELENLSKSGDVESIYTMLKVRLEKELEIATCLYEESCFRWALKNIELSSPNPLSTLVPDKVFTEVVTKLAGKGVISTVSEKSSNKKQSFKSAMLNCHYRINEVKKEINALNRILENTLTDQKILSKINESKMR